MWNVVMLSCYQIRMISNNFPFSLFLNMGPQDCGDNTSGDHCHVCAPGYYGKVTGSATDCSLCTCPHSGPARWACAEALHTCPTEAGGDSVFSPSFQGLYMSVLINIFHVLRMANFRKSVKFSQALEENLFKSKVSVLVLGCENGTN